MNIPKITILIDDGYQPSKIIEELEKIYPQNRSKILFEQSSKPTKIEKAAEGKFGFVSVKM